MSGSNIEYWKVGYRGHGRKRFDENLMSAMRAWEWGWTVTDSKKGAALGISGGA